MPLTDDSQKPRKGESLYLRSKYYGDSSPQHFIFNASLQKFAQRVSLLSALETGGKITPQEAYKDVKQLWKELKRSKKILGIGIDKPK